MVSWNLLIHGYAAQQNGENVMVASEEATRGGATKGAQRHLRGAG
jgi:hypothetical protein